jgi:hypothetical protein
MRPCKENRFRGSSIRIFCVGKVNGCVFYFQREREREREKAKTKATKIQPELILFSVTERKNFSFLHFFKKTIRLTPQQEVTSKCPYV